MNTARRRFLEALVGLHAAGSSTAGYANMVMRSARSRYIAPPVPPSTVDDGDWLVRSTAPGVFRTYHFNDVSQLGDNWSSGVRGTLGYGWQMGTGPGGTAPSIDPDVKVSGSGSLRMTYLSGSSANGAGNWISFFSADGTRRFGPNTTLWAQFRLRVNHGWTQIWDRNAGTKVFAFTRHGGGTNPSLVMNTWHSRPYPIMYTGNRGFALYELHHNPNKQYLQNGEPPFCVYPATLGTPLVAGCYSLVPDEWFTVKIHADIGDMRPDGRYWDARVRVWMKRYGQPSQLIIDYGPDTPGYVNNSPNGWPAKLDQFDAGAYTQFQFIPYTTNKGLNHGDNVHDTAHVWYDELILSTQDIPDPVDGYPLWRRDKNVGQVYEIPNSAQMGDPTYATFSQNVQSDTIDNFSGCAVDEDHCRWIAALHSGHAKACGEGAPGWINPVITCDFLSDTPKWRYVDRGSTYDKVSINRYYADGRPQGRHAYGTHVYIGEGKMADGRERIGVPSGFAGYAQDVGNTNKCGNVDDGTGVWSKGPGFEMFRLNRLDWLAHPTFDGSVHGWELQNDARDVPAFLGTNAGEASVTIVRHPVTHDIWAGGGGPTGAYRSLWKWTALTDTWSGPHIRSDQQPLFSAAAGATGLFDRLRNKIVIFVPNPIGPDRLIKIDPDTYAITSITMPVDNQGPPTNTNTRMVHDLDNDRYVFAKPEGTANAQGRTAYRFWAIEPDRGIYSDISGLLPFESRNGLHTHFSFLPSLHCIVSLADFKTPIRFMPTA